MNSKRTSGSNCAETVPKRLCIVRDNDDNVWGPFSSPGDAAEWAEKKWPHLPQRHGEGWVDGHGCWDVEDVFAP